jgi:hypothetical protein
MNKQITITTNTEALSKLRFLNDSLHNHLRTLSVKDEICEILKYLNHNVSQITNLYQKEIEDYEQFLIEEQTDFNRFNKEGRKLNLVH